MSGERQDLLLCLRRVVDRFELDDLEPTSHRRKLQHDGLSYASSDQRPTNWRRHADVIFLELDRVSEDEAVALTLTGLFVLHDDLGTKSDFVGRNLRNVDLRQLAETLAQLTQARLHELLALEGSFVFAVLAQIAELYRLPNLLRQRDVQLVLKPLSFFSEFFL